ncbi:M42 family metallopeptidase [Thermodesulfatator autotrophicus]|uniref:Peptidase M42 n=1 Tax=Thermodesulfatator autotrophicus TaxID=1795632 RepID=A0A177ECM5_9BACT|nr:M42 family peptidase [Thermodesulfatator autotrophicus]OAG28749.1 hypothetical protein TH606_00355 [Thermodesulfatator autotrophicus]
MRYEFLRKLCEAPGVPGAETPVKEIFLEELKPFVDEIEEDPLGNILLHKKGRGPKILLDAHLDEVAFMVAGLEGAFLRVVPLGGVDPKVFYGQRLIVWGRQRLPAVVVSHPPHIGQEKKDFSVEELYLDLGLGAEKLADLVKVGDLVTFPPYFEETEEAIMAKALDDRVGLFVIAEALAQINPRADLFISATVQEEVGLRGAQGLKIKEPFDAVLALEGTFAADTPGLPAHLKATKAGQGPEIRLSDARFVADRHLALGLAELATKKGILHQVVVKNRGSTNATAFQITQGATRAVAVSVPVRYLHTPVNLAFKKDIEATVELLKAFLEDPQDALAYRWSYPS